MQTQLLPRIENDSIYLEFLDPTSGRSNKSLIEDFPFIIGRNATCSLTVESGRVSREHAEIVRHGSGYLIRDLHSTNGVYVNGEQVSEHVLVDGDTVSIADFEFDFHCPCNAESRATVTLSMEDREQAAAEVEDPDVLIQALRTVNQWSGLNRIDPHLVALQSLSSQQVVGHWCPLFGKAYQSHPEFEQLQNTSVLENPFRLLQHVSAMFSLLERQTAGAMLVLEIDQADLHRPDLLETVGWIRAKFGSDLSVLLGGSIDLWNANLGSNNLVEDLRSMGVQLAAVGIDQVRAPIVSDVLQQMSLIGIAASALSAASRSPAIANNVQEIIKERAGSGCQAIAQANSGSPANELLQQMGFPLIARFSN